MKLNIELHGVLRRLAGSEVLVVELADGATVADALLQLPGDAGLRVWLDRCACAVGDSLVPRAQPLRDGTTLALIPPVSGG